MTDARLAVTGCGPLTSYQDGGRFGMMRFGVPASGPMDRLAHAAANVALGRPWDATGVEIGIGGIELACEAGEVTVAVTGGAFRVSVSGAAATSWCVRTLRSGDVLSVRPGRWGSWAYLAFAGDVICERWAGRTATHSMAGLGGGALVAGAAVVVRDARVTEDREGPLVVPDPAAAPRRVRVVLGPQTARFEPRATELLLAERFEVTAASDRMGMRLAGPALALRDALSIPSEPIVRGSLQVSGDGVASILLADHQTTGGYPKIATVLSMDVDRVAQLRPRDPLGFDAVEPHEAVRLARAHAAAKTRYLAALATPRGTLVDRLMRENLVSGVVHGDDESPAD
jgi:allophanate hydrolase